MKDSPVIFLAEDADRAVLVVRRPARPGPEPRLLVSVRHGAATDGPVALTREQAAELWFALNGWLQDTAPAAADPIGPQDQE